MAQLHSDVVDGDAACTVLLSYTPPTRRTVRGMLCVFCNTALKENPGVYIEGLLLNI